MSLFDDPLYQWRETYFIFFDRRRRPKLKDVEEALKDTQHHQIERPLADEEGRFEALTVIAHEDASALDISYLEGEEVAEELADLVEELRGAAASAEEKARFETLLQHDARLDVMHFEELVGEEEGEAFDPTALLSALKRLTKLTHGICVDPQSGTLM